MNKHHITILITKRHSVFYSDICLVIICLFLTLTGTVWAKDSLTAGTRNNQAGGSHDILPGKHKCKVDSKRKYLLYIPQTYNSSRPTPLVLFFHGGGGHME